MINDDIIRLRALEPEDLECLYQWENDMDLWEVSDTLTPFSLFTLKKYIETCHLDIYTTRMGSVAKMMDADSMDSDML